MVNRLRSFIGSVLFVAVSFLAVSAQAMWQQPLEQVCAVGAGVGYMKSLKAFDRLSGIIAPGSLGGEECLKSELVLRAGRIWIYKQTQTKQLILIQLDHKKEISDVSISPENFPDVRIERADLMMADGIKIPTFIFHPEGVSKPSLVTLLRSPYIHGRVWEFASGLKSAQKGFRYVLQPARGTFTAPGTFEWLDWKQEREDARATLDWISKQSWSNQKVIALGTSYPGFLAMAAATTFHPSLKAVFATSVPWNPQKDSLSEGGKFLSAANYVLNLNSFGGEEEIQLSELTGKSKNFQEFRTKMESLSGFKFKSLPDNFKYSDNADFIVELKKATAVMVYGFGVVGDQDSRDVINLYRKLKGTPGHYFIGHDQKHSDAPLNTIYQNILSSGTAEKEQFSLKLKELTGEHQTCLLVDYEKMKFGCGDDFSSAVGGVRVVRAKLKNLVFKDTVQGMKLGVLEKAETVFGVKRVKITVKAPKSFSSNIWLNLAWNFCDAQKCVVEGKMMESVSVQLHEGIGTYIFEWQHDFQSLPANTEVRLHAFVGTYNGEQIPNAIFEVNSLELSLPLLK